MILSKHIAGVKPLSAGYEKVEISPRYELHKNIICLVPTIKGDIKIDVATKDETISINLHCPEGVDVELVHPENAIVTRN